MSTSPDDHLDAEEGQQPGSDDDERRHARESQQVAQHLERRQRRDSQLDPDRHRQERLDADQDDPDPAQRRAGDNDPLVPRQGGEADRAENADSGGREPEHEQAVHHLPPLGGAARERHFAAADGREARVGDARDDPEHGSHRRVATEVVHPEVAEEQDGRGEPKRRADREANPAEEAAANDPTAGLGGAEEVERQIVCVAGRFGRGWACYPSTSGTWARRSIWRCQRWRALPSSRRSTTALPGPSPPSGRTASTA